MKLSSTTRSRVRGVQYPKSLYNFEDIMNSEDLESPGRLENDVINLNVLTEHKARSEDKKAGEKSKTILTRDAKSQSRNYENYNQGSQVEDVEMGDYMKKRESAQLNDTDKIRAINNISHKIDTTPDTTVSTISFEDSIDDFDDLVIWNNKILESDDGWSGNLMKNNMKTQAKIRNITDQFSEFLNNSKLMKNQSDDYINDFSADLQNTAAKHSKQYSKPSSFTQSRVVTQGSEKYKQRQLNNFFLDEDRIVTSEVMLKRLNSLNSILGSHEERLKNIYVKKSKSFLSCSRWGRGDKLEKGIGL